MDEDILSQHPNAILMSRVEGYVVKCNSFTGICFEDKKTRTENFFSYVITNYRDGWDEFSRTEYYLPKGTLILEYDCRKGHGQCNQHKINAVAALFKQYYGKHYLTRSKKINKPKSKRACRCKK
jgi:hypothetical protein